MYFIVDYLMNNIFSIYSSSDMIVFYSAVLLLSLFVFFIIYLFLSYLFILFVKSTTMVIRNKKINYFELNIRREFAKVLSLILIATFLFVEIIFISANYKGEGYYFYLNYIYILVSITMAIIKVYQSFWLRKEYLQKLIEKTN